MTVLANPRESHPWEADVPIRAAVRGVGAAACGSGRRLAWQRAVPRGGLLLLAVRRGGSLALAAAGIAEQLLVLLAAGLLR